MGDQNSTACKVVIAAAQAAGCPELLTEDIAHGRVIDGVEIVNPFR